MRNQPRFFPLGYIPSLWLSIFPVFALQAHTTPPCTITFLNWCGHGSGFFAEEGLREDYGKSYREIFQSHISMMSSGKLTCLILYKNELHFGVKVTNYIKSVVSEAFGKRSFHEALCNSCLARDMRRNNACIGHWFTLRRTCFQVVWRSLEQGWKNIKRSFCGNYKYKIFSYSW